MSKSIHALMFKKILAPITHTKSSRRMREVACAMAKDLGASIHYVTIHTKEMSGTDEDETMLKIMEESCTNQGIDATYELIDTESSENILTLLADMSKDYDLLVMGHCRYEKMYKFLHDSLAENLIKISHCPVTVVSSECGKK